MRKMFDAAENFAGSFKVNTSPAVPFVFLCQICVNTSCLQMFVATCQAAHALITHSIKAYKTAELRLINDNLILTN